MLFHIIVATVQWTINRLLHYFWVWKEGVRIPRANVGVEPTTGGVYERRQPLGRVYKKSKKSKDSSSKVCQKVVVAITVRIDPEKPLSTNFHTINKIYIFWAELAGGNFYCLWYSVFHGKIQNSSRFYPNTKILQRMESRIFLVLGFVIIGEKNRVEIWNIFYTRF